VDYAAVFSSGELHEHHIAGGTDATNIKCGLRIGDPQRCLRSAADDAHREIGESFSVNVCSQSPSLRVGHRGRREMDPLGIIGAIIDAFVSRQSGDCRGLSQLDRKPKQNAQYTHGGIVAHLYVRARLRLVSFPRGREESKKTWSGACNKYI